MKGREGGVVIVDRYQLALHKHVGGGVGAAEMRWGRRRARGREKEAYGALERVMSIENRIFLGLEGKSDRY